MQLMPWFWLPHLDFMRSLPKSLSGHVHSEFSGHFLPGGFTVIVVSLEGAKWCRVFGLLIPRNFEAQHISFPTLPNCFNTQAFIFSCHFLHFFQMERMNSAVACHCCLCGWRVLLCAKFRGSTSKTSLSDWNWSIFTVEAFREAQASLHVETSWRKGWSEAAASSTNLCDTWHIWHTWHQLLNDTKGCVLYSWDLMRFRSHDMSWPRLLCCLLVFCLFLFAFLKHQAVTRNLVKSLKHFVSVPKIKDSKADLRAKGCQGMARGTMSMGCFTDLHAWYTGWSICM